MKYILITLFIILLNISPVLAQDSYATATATSGDVQANSYANASADSSSSNTGFSVSSGSSVSQVTYPDNQPIIYYWTQSSTSPEPEPINRNIENIAKPIPKSREENPIKIIALDSKSNGPINSNQDDETQGKIAELIPLTEKQSIEIRKQKKEISQINKLNNTLTYTIFVLILLVILGLVALTLFLHKNRVRKVIKY